MILKRTFSHWRHVDQQEMYDAAPITPRTC